MAVRPIDAMELKQRMCALCNQYYSDEPCEPSDCVFVRVINEAPTLTPPNEWVSVEERLPEPTYCVLVYTTDYSIEVDALDSDGEWMSFEVTHWMSLPAPPDKDNNVPTKAPNEPLTIEQLREMGGQPVYMPETNCWALVTQSVFCPILTFPDGEKCSAYDWYEQVGPVYRRPPDGEEDT